MQKILRIFGRYRHYGGEEGVARRIHATLEPYMDAEWFESSTDSLLGRSFVQTVQAPFNRAQRRGGTSIAQSSGCQKF